MGTRALRKLREQEWQRKLAAAQEDENDDSASQESDEPVVVSKPKNAFDMLNAEEESDDEPEAVEHPDAPPPTTTAASPPQSGTPKSSKKKKKKPKKKKAGTTETPEQIHSKDVSEDEIDKALKELALKHPAQDASTSLSTHDIWLQNATKHLAIEPRNLDPVNEMRGLFGNIALEDDSRVRNQPTRRRDQNMQGGVDLQTALSGRYNRASRGKELGALAKRRNCFVQGREEWPLATSGGLSMEALPVQGVEKSYNIIHSQVYKSAQWDFKMAVESMQAEALIGLLQKHPYHIATLVQVSEIAKHQGDASLSGDLLQRALYTFGRSVNSSFPAAMRDGCARLSFNKPANRELYLAVWRFIRNLEQRGTWKTAFEWSKLLLQFDPHSDPFGVTLMIDQLALRGRQHEQFLEMTSPEAYGNTWAHLPNICISKTLALLRANKPREARQQLALAMHRYPYILSSLASAIEVSPIPKSIWGKLPANDAEKLHSELYVTRARDLWNTPETIGLISEVANTMQYYKSFVDSRPEPPRPQISLEEARHIMALETPALIALLPRTFTNMPTSSSDILPPPTSEVSDLVRRAPNEGFAGRDGPGLMQAGNDLFARLLGWFTSPTGNARTGQGDGPAEGQLTAEDIAAFRDELGPEAANIPDDVLRRMINDQMAAEFGEMDEDELRQAFTAGPPMAGDWDYYEDAANNGDSDESAEMPELEDIENPNSRAGNAIAGELLDDAANFPAARAPHAATVEEAEDEDETHSGPNLRSHSGAILRHIDETEPDTSRLEDTQRHMDSHLPPRRPVTGSSSSVVQPSPATDEDIESDPQRLQRWLITAGVEELQAKQNISTYVRRLQMLRKNQQTWTLSMLRQRGHTDLATKVENAL